MDVLVLIDKLDDLVHNAKPMPLTDQVRTELGELPFLKFREAVEKRLACDQAEHGVAQELEHFVITGGRTIACAQRLHLASLRAVSEGLLQQFRALEAVTQAHFQFHDVV